MVKALNFDDSKVQESEEIRKIPNSGDVKKLLGRGLKLEADKDAANADLKGFYADVKEQGIDPKAMKALVKYKKRPISEEFKQEVNELFEKAGEQLLFAFA